MAVAECVDLLFILSLENRACNVAQKPAGPDETGCIIENCGLFGAALFQRLRRELPLGVWMPAPCAGAGARRIDHHAIKPALQLGKISIGSMDLNVARAGPLEPLEDRCKPLLVIVIGVDLALIVHAGGERERFASCPGTQIEHLLARLGKDKIGDDLAALVLHLEPALLKGRFGGHIRQAARAFRRLDADALAGNRRRLGTGLFQRFKNLGAVSLERVDAQIERRSFGKGLGFINPFLFEVFSQQITGPWRHVSFNPRISEGEVPCFPGLKLPHRNLRRELVIGQLCLKLVQRHRPLPGNRCKNQGRRCVIIHVKRVGRALAQHIINQIADGRAVTRPGKTMRLAPIGQRHRNRAVVSCDVVKNFNGCGQPAAKAHVGDPVRKTSTVCNAPKRRAPLEKHKRSPIYR